MTTLALRDLDAPFGAEVRGFDPETRLDDATLRVLQDAFDEQGVLVFRDLDIEFEAQARLCERLAGTDGLAAERTAASPANDFYVSNYRPDGLTPFGRLPFHSDGMWSDQPNLALSLYATEIEAPAVPTRFASTARAWATLPEELKQRTVGLHGVHIMGVIPRGEHAEEIVVALFDPVVSTVAPIAHTHPRTGRPLLYVSQQMTREVVELAPDESEELLAELFAYLYDPANVLEHEWRERDLVIWDNVAVQHARPDVLTDGPVRTLRKFGTPDLAVTAAAQPTYLRRD